MCKRDPPKAGFYPCLWLQPCVGDLSALSLPLNNSRCPLGSKLVITTPSTLLQNPTKTCKFNEDLWLKQWEWYCYSCVLKKHLDLNLPNVDVACKETSCNWDPVETFTVIISQTPSCFKLLFLFWTSMRLVLAPIRYPHHWSCHCLHCQHKKPRGSCPCQLSLISSSS